MINDELTVEGAGITRANATNDQFSAAKSWAKNRAEGMIFLLHSNKHRYGKLVKELTMAKIVTCPVLLKLLS
jgi:hypothetical protein